MADITYKELDCAFLYEAKTKRGLKVIDQVGNAGVGYVFVVKISHLKVLKKLRKYCTVAKYKEPSLQAAYAAAGKIFEGC